MERRDILLEIDKDIRVDLQLSPGEITQTVEVTGSAPLVDSQTVTLGGTLSNETINDLPLNGRNFINLLSLRPGVEQYPWWWGAWTQAGNGLRIEDVNWVIDGLDNNESNQGLPVSSTLPEQPGMPPRSCRSMPSRSSTSRKIPKLSGDGRRGPWLMLGSSRAPTRFTDPRTPLGGPMRGMRKNYFDPKDRSRH